MAAGIAVAAGPPVVRITSAGKDLLTSGVVNTFDSNGLEIELDDLRFEFVFEGGHQTSPKLLAEPKGPKTLVLKLEGWGNPLGTGTLSPVELGTLRGRKLYISFFVESVNEHSSRVFHYSFYLGDQVERK